MSIRNVSFESDDYFDSFPVRFHISDFGMIHAGDEFITRNIAEELNLKVISCRYGANLDGFNLHPSMKQLILNIEEKYGKVKEDDIPGFIALLEATLKNGKMVYFIAAGNNGQEISTGIHLSDVNLLDDKETRRTIQQLDAEIHDMILNSKLTEFSY